MEDPFGQARWAMYARIMNRSDGQSDSTLTGLFTRPAILAISDETAGGLPVRALNRACRILLTLNTGADRIIEEGGPVNRVAEVCGFGDVNHFIRLFREATGWHPEEWRRRYGHAGMPRPEERRL